MTEFPLSARNRNLDSLGTHLAVISLNCLLKLTRQRVHERAVTCFIIMKPVFNPRAFGAGIKRSPGDLQISCDASALININLSAGVIH